MFIVATIKHMDATASSSRQERGAALAKAKTRSFRQIAGDTYFVPSQTNAGSGYVVDVQAGKCSCPDFEERGGPCKHVFAVRYFRHELTTPDGSTVVTEGIRITYPQDWPSYNRAQCEEESTVKVLLASLCDGIEQPVQHMGRKRMPLRDVVYGSTMKVYGTMSGRRSTTDLRACEDAGHVDKAPAYNTVFKYMEKPELLPLLSRLVDESARPLAAVERNFAVDGTGFASPTYVRWFDYKHGEDRRVQQWVKLHAAVGTLTNVITAATVTTGHANDSPEFGQLVERTAASFRVEEVSADKAYLSHANLATVERVGAVAFVPFKSNSGSSGSDAWERMYHYFSLNKEAWLTHYHRRSNVESTFSAMKRKFGAGVRSKTTAAQFNEVLLKCLCHNLSMLVHSIHEMGIEPRFWLPRAVDA
jgi:transposase